MAEKRWVGKESYLVLDGKYMGSRQFLRNVNAKTNQTIIEESRRLAQELVDEINAVIQELVKTYPQPRFSVWRKYRCVLQNESIKYDSNNFASYTADIIVETDWTTFNLWDVLDQGKTITFQETVHWPQLAEPQLNIPSSSTQPLTINASDYRQKATGRVQWYTRKVSPENPGVVNYAKYHLFERIAARLNKKYADKQGYERLTKTAQGYNFRRKTPSISLNILTRD